MRHASFNLNDLFDEIKEKAFDEGAFDRASWDDMVEVIVNEKQATQEVHDDLDWLGVTEVMKARFDDFAEEVPVA